MTSEIQALLQAALRMPKEARVTLVAELILSLDAPGAPIEEVESVWANEVGARVSDLDAGHVTTIPRAEAEARMFAAVRARREAP